MAKDRHPHPQQGIVSLHQRTTTIRETRQKTSNSDDTTCLRNSRRRQKRATGSGNACTGIRRTKGRKPWISGQNGREKWRNFGILPEFYVPKKQKHRTSFTQSTALSPLKYGTFSQRSPYFSVFHASISTPSVAPEGKKDRKTEEKRSRTAARNNTENLKIF